MKDKNGIEIDCSNCTGVDDCIDKSFLKYCRNRPFEFLPSTKAYESRIQELQELVATLNQKLFNKEQERRSESIIKDKLIADLQAEIGLYRDEKSHITDVKLSPKFIKSIIQAVNSEVEILKRELRFTDEEIDFIEKAISMEILDCETNSPKPSDEKLKLMRSIKSKCDELLKEIKD